MIVPRIHCIVILLSAHPEFYAQVIGTTSPMANRVCQFQRTHIQSPSFITRYCMDPGSKLELAQTPFHQLHHPIPALKIVNTIIACFLQMPTFPTTCFYKKRFFTLVLIPQLTRVGRIRPLPGSLVPLQSFTQGVIHMKGDVPITEWHYVAY
jgi:hypothetical protein